MEAGKRNITDIFNRSRLLEIPFFQRSYVWKEDNWDRFLNDIQRISELNCDYFMGSVILKAQSVASGEPVGDQRVIVDGQQRLTTIIIFFKVLCTAQNNLQLFNDMYLNLMTKEIILKHNHNDKEIFEAIVHDRLTEKLKTDYKDNDVLNCYLYFMKNMGIVKNVNVNNIINKLYFVGIDLGLEEDEQQIFDTINSLGVYLTTAELLKNELFRRSDEEYYRTTWKEIFEKDEDSRNYWDLEVTGGRQYRENIDLLLQSVLLIISEAKDKYLGLESLFSNYKSFIKDSGINKRDLVSSLIEYAKIYQENINPNQLSRDIDSNSTIARLNIIVFGLNTTTILPYILYILKEVPSKDERDKIFKLLESFLLRRLICKETPKNYNNMFASFIRNKINTFEMFKEKIYSAEDPSSIFPDDNDLREGFLRSNLTNQQATVVLYLLEKSIRDEKYSTNLLPIKDYSLEHIMPIKWEKNWRADLSEEQGKRRDDLVRKIGNFTIIKMELNGSISNASWDIKKNGKNGQKGLNEYAKGIKIFDKYLELADWNEDSIITRGNELFEWAKTVWVSDIPIRSRLSSTQKRIKLENNVDDQSEEDMGQGNIDHEKNWKMNYSITYEAANILKDILNEIYTGVLELKYSKSRISLWWNGKWHFAFESSRKGKCWLWSYINQEDKGEVAELLKQSSFQNIEWGDLNENSDGSYGLRVWMPDVNKTILLNNAEVLKKLAVIVHKIWK